MAKFQSRNNNQKQNNFFTQSIKDKGENFLDFMTAKDLQFSALKIFRELARGRIDVKEYGDFFLEPPLLEALFIEGEKKYKFYSITYNSVLYSMNVVVAAGQCPDQDVVAVSEDLKRSLDAYGIIMNTLIALKTNGNASILYGAINALRYYKNNI